MKNPVDSSLQKEEIKKIFNSIAPNYDRANRAITLGMDRSWRKKLVKWSDTFQKENVKILDCATGTGDLALEFQKQLGSKATVIGLDFSEEMLIEGRKKNKDIQFIMGDVQAIPFPADFFDTCSIAYGLRNVEDIHQTLNEMIRVLKPGGHLMILETGSEILTLLAPLCNLYFRQVVPRLGGLITGHKEAYQYLQKSSSVFPAREQMLDILKQTNKLTDLEYKPVFFGASFLYKAQKKS